MAQHSADQIVAHLPPGMQNELLRQHHYPSGQQLEIVRGDLTAQAVDAIVNAANARLQHGGGVAGLIAQRGGQVIEQQSDAWVKEHGPVSHAEPAYTEAGALPCRYVIHAVGPVWGDGDEDRKLAAAVSGSLRVADRLQLDSLALPAISTGIFGFPKERAAGVIYRALENYFAAYPDSGLQRVRLTLYDQPTVRAFQNVWDARESTGG